MKIPFQKNGNGSSNVTLSEEESRLLSSLAQAIQLSQTNFQIAYEQVCRRHQKDPVTHDLVPTPGQAGRVDLCEKAAIAARLAQMQQAQAPQQ